MELLARANSSKSVSLPTKVENENLPSPLHLHHMELFPALLVALPLHHLLVGAGVSAGQNPVPLLMKLAPIQE